MTSTIDKSFRWTQEALRSGGGITDVDESIVREVISAATPARAMSAFKRASLREKKKLEMRFRVPMAHSNPVHDEMGAGTSAERSGAYGIDGASFDLLLESEVFNPHGTCLSQVRVFSFFEWDARTNAPHENGLLDERMGVVRGTDHHGAVVHCPVCSGYKNVDQYVNEKSGAPGLCPGHFGHIMLPAALWHPMMETHVIRMLRTFCWHCGSLPGTDEKNRAVVAAMFNSCASRVRKLAFLASHFVDQRWCAQCSKARRCVACRGAAAQCIECAEFKYFRPKLRTYVQATRAKAKLAEHIMNTDSLGEDKDDVVRAVRGNNYTGFPCDVLLNGNVKYGDEKLGEQEAGAYATFAAEQYGRSADITVLTMHGERVRAVIQQMSDDYLRLFCTNAFETPESVRAWFRTMVPRIIPVAPNPARPTTIGHGGSMSIRTDDLTKRYKNILLRCAAFSKRLNPEHSREDPPLTMYDQQADIFASRRNSWFLWGDADFTHLEVYGELQYFYACMITPSRATNFRPALAASHGIGNSAAARKKKKGSGGAGGENGGRSTTLVSALEQRLVSKEGRVRENLMGKRTELSARSVITPAHRISVRDVRVPASIASRFYVRERVTGISVAQLSAVAERARTQNTDALRDHAACGGHGCRQCERLYVDDKTELCIFNAAHDERIRITGPQALQTPVSKHPFLHEIGATVERTLRSGDTISINRMPSLHKYSVMCHRVVVDGTSHTIGINECACKPYNADFDGDEMHAYLTAGLEARVEAETLMAASTCIISACDSAPIFSLTQNAATGMYLLTSRNTFLEHREVCELYMLAEHDVFPTPGGMPCLRQPAIRYKDARGKWRLLWTGLQIANLTLPQTEPYFQYRHTQDVEFSRSSLDYPPDGLKNSTVLPMLIENSEILYGRIEASVAGASAKSITASLVRRTNLSLDRAQEEACDFIDKSSWLGSAFLTLHGFSIGIADCIPPPQIVDKIRQLTDDVEVEVVRLLLGDKGVTQTDEHSDRVSVIEQNVMEIERKTFDAGMALTRDSVPPSNGFCTMRVSGGKGKIENITQSMCFVGGQTVDGRRSCDTYANIKNFGGESTLGIGGGNSVLSETTSAGNGERKTTTSFLTIGPTLSTRYLDYLGKRLNYHAPRALYPGSAEGGFVKNSYLSGLTPWEFFCHAKAGREGLIDTAVKTADSGDSQRLAMKSSEDVVVRGDSTVRNSANQVVSFRYAGTNFDVAALQHKSLSFIDMSDEALARALFYDRKRDIAFKRDTSETMAQRLDATSTRTRVTCSIDILANEESELRRRLAHLRRISSIRCSGSAVCTPNNIPALIIDVLVEMRQNRYGAVWLAIDDKRIEWLKTRLARDDEIDALRLTQLGEADAAQLVDSACRRWRAKSICDYVTETEVRMRLSSKQVTRRLWMSKETLRRVLELFEETLYRAQVAPGECVGAIMVQSIGQPATQRTLNTFHLTGLGNMTVLGGIPRMKEIGNAALTENMKTLKVVLPLITGVLLFVGQRKLAANIVAQLVSRQTLSFSMSAAIAAALPLPRNERAAAHKSYIAELMRLPAHREATQRVKEQRGLFERAIAEQSAHKRTVDVKAKTEALFTELARLGSSERPSVTSKARTHTLHAVARQWRVESAIPRRESGWPDDAAQLFERAHKVLLVTVAEGVREQTTPELVCESFWRSLVVVFGCDAKFDVVARIDTNSLMVTDIAVLALDCSESYENKMYEYVRVNRHTLFVDLLCHGDAERTVMLRRAALLAGAHSAPELFATNVGSHSESKREEELMYRKQTAINTAQVRHLFKNVVSTRIFDIVDSFSLFYEPIHVDPSSGDVSVAINVDKRFPPSETDLLDYQTHFCNGCFDVMDVGCQKPACLAARDDPASEHHVRATTGCLSSWVLVLRLSEKWFLRNEVTTRLVADTLSAELGAFFYVTIGDDNCTPHIPLRIRVLMCQVDEALKLTNYATLTRLDQFSLDNATCDRAQLVLDRIKWEVLGFTFCGPLRGSSVMCEQERTQIFTEERGIEHVKRPVLVSNSSDLYHLLSLRGIDVRRARTNSVHDALTVFGVEAARLTAMNQYAEVLNSSIVNRAHYALRADIQTRNGGFMPLTAAGLRSAPHDVCQSASHRETAMMFVSAALNQSSAFPFVSPSASVMFGQPGRFGTGTVTLVPDVDLLLNPDARCLEQPEPSDVLVAIDRDNELAREEEWRVCSSLSSLPIDVEREALAYALEDRFTQAQFSPVRESTPVADDHESALIPSFDAFIRIDQLPEPRVAAKNARFPRPYLPEIDSDDESLDALLLDHADSTPPPQEKSSTKIHDRISKARLTTLLEAVNTGAVHEYEPTSPAYDVSEPYIPKRQTFTPRSKDADSDDEDDLAAALDFGGYAKPQIRLY